MKIYLYKLSTKLIIFPNLNNMNQFHYIHAITDFSVKSRSKSSLHLMLFQHSDTLQFAQYCNTDIRIGAAMVIFFS